VILVTGTTGTNGGELARQLSGAGVPFRALVRDPARAQAVAALPGAALVTGDLDDPASLAPALDGVTRAFLVTPSTAEAEARQRRFVVAAREAGVRHVVKLSQIHADPGSPVRFLRYHASVEQALRDSGMAWTFLRPNLFMQALLQFAPMIAQGAPLAAPAGEGRVSVVDVRDIAAAAHAALTGDGHEGQVYELTGPEALTHAEIARRIGAAVGREVPFVDAPPDQFRAALGEFGMDPWQADGLIEDYAHYARDEAAAVADGVARATGRAPRDFDTFAREHAAAFHASDEQP
jgi:uncharacterized protein YbjT (DUF2867 family)